MFQYAISQNLALALLTPQDADALFSLTDDSRAHLREWLPWLDATQSPQHTRGFIETGLRQFADNQGFQTGIWYEGRLAGCIGLHAIDWPNRSTTMGYWLGRDFQGHGLMTQAATAVVNIVFQRYQLNRIDIRAAQGNLRSQGVAKRLGFWQEGVIRQAEWLYDHYVDHVLYAMLREYWGAGHA